MTVKTVNTATEKQNMAKKDTSDKSVMISARLPESLVESAKNAAWHVGRGWNFTRMIEEGLKLLTGKLEKDHNGGKPFPRRDE